MEKRILLSLLFILSLNCLKAQDFAIGARFGDPSGLTFKKYSGNRAIELNIGRSYWIYGRGWYDRNFNGWYDKYKYNYAEYKYVGYRSTFPLGIQLHYLFHRDIAAKKDNVGKMQWYYGLGAQFRYQKFYYSYYYKLKGDPNWYYQGDEAVSNFDIGADGILGLEYKFNDVPLSAFLDVNVFLELADAPFVFWFQSGIGVRVHL